MAYIGAPITVAFDRPPLYSKRPHCPDRFTWEGETFVVEWEMPPPPAHPSVTWFRQSTVWRTSPNPTPAGLAQEDVAGLERLEMYPVRTLPELMVLLDNFTIEGVSGGPKDIFDLESGIWVHNLAAQKIDALATGPAQP